MEMVRKIKMKGSSNDELVEECKDAVSAPLFSFSDYNLI
jgi:hypothetical protein